MNSENRAKALAKLAALYEIDLEDPYYGGPRVAEYLDRPDSIRCFVAVGRTVGDFGPDGEQLWPTFYELRAEYDEPWALVDEAERVYDQDWEPEMVAVADLDRWEILGRGLNGWSFRPLSRQGDA